MRNAFVHILSELARKDATVYVITGDAGYGVFDSFQQKWPKRFINVGVAEANMIGYAAGLALAGFNVFVYNIIPFVLYRCYEQVRNDICYQRLPVTLVGIGSGVTYAPSGMTHYSVEDLNLCASLPNLEVISPMDPVETAAAVRYAHGSGSPVFIRLAKSGEAVIRPDRCPDIRRPAVIREGGEIALLAHGSIFPEAVAACEQLEPLGIHPRLISVPFIQPFPEAELLRLLNGTTLIVCLEEHFRTGGLATRTAEWILRRGLDCDFIPLTLPDRFIHEVNHQAGLRKRYGIDAESVAKAVYDRLSEGSVHRRRRRGSPCR